MQEIGAVIIILTDPACLQLPHPFALWDTLASFLFVLKWIFFSIKMPFIFPDMSWFDITSKYESITAQLAFLSPVLLKCC